MYTLDIKHAREGHYIVRHEPIDRGNVERDGIAAKALDILDAHTNVNSISVDLGPTVATYTRRALR